MKFKLTLASLFVSILCFSQDFRIHPYIENAEPNDVHISWMTDSGTESLVEYGTTQTLGSLISGSHFTTAFNDELHEVELTNLTPNTLYYYRVQTGSLFSELYEFTTPPAQNLEKSFNIIAMSDMQRDNANPQVFDHIVNNGVLEILDQYPEDHLSENLGLVMIPGDLVVNGLDYESWMNEFFDPMKEVMARVPIYPVLGNHEVNTSYYFDFFHLPENGTEDLEEHWWYKDYSNVRIIGLDSNSPYDNSLQLIWLNEVLDETCADEDIDFIFLELHHPHKSELWLPGESGFTTNVVERLEDFSTDCGKPSIHFFGHTHGYSRGQSREHNHLMVNVASAGGNIDYWGEFSQTDYEEFTVTQPEWGFVLVEVEAGDDPKFVLKRYSQGNELMSLPNMLRDSIEVKRNNIPPDTPHALFPLNESISPDCALLIADEISDPDQHGHMASEWQVSEISNDFSNPIYHSFKTHENWYLNINTQAGDIMNDELVTNLPENSTLFWRVRYRDHSLGWSEWSDQAEFTTTTSNTSPNLVLNPGAENGNSNWTTNQGNLEVLTAEECGGTVPHSGTYYFGVGGLCNDQEFGEAYQSISLADYQTEILNGDMMVKFGAYMSDYAGDDIPEFQIYFYNESGTQIDQSETVTSSVPSWTYYEAIQEIPSNTASIDFYIRGTRNAGNDNDSYIDDIFLFLSNSSCDPNSFDQDEDGIIDSADNCLSTPNPDQGDWNNDNQGDLCQDFDEDGISDFDELQTYGSDPGSSDSDLDGISDFEEVFTQGTNPTLQDSDFDGLTDFVEVNTSFTDPNNPDSDGDGCTDDLYFGQLCVWQTQCEIDTNGDNVVNILDLVNVSSNFGSICE